MTNELEEARARLATALTTGGAIYAGPVRIDDLRRLLSAPKGEVVWSYDLNDAPDDQCLVSVEVDGMRWVREVSRGRGWEAAGAYAWADMPKHATLSHTGGGGGQS